MKPNEEWGEEKKTNQEENKEETIAIKRDTNKVRTVVPRKEYLQMFVRDYCSDFVGIAFDRDCLFFNILDKKAITKSVMQLYKTCRNDALKNLYGKPLNQWILPE